MVDLALRDQVIQDLRRTILHLIDIDTSIEQQPLAADWRYIHEWQLVVATSRQSRSWIEPRPSPGSLEVEFGHLEAEFHIRIDLAS
jgi:hypothetical protein